MQSKCLTVSVDTVDSSPIHFLILNYSDPMKLQNQVCALAQAKKLKELGIVQKDAAFYHYALHINGKMEMVLWPYLQLDFSQLQPCDFLERALTGESKNEIYAAFTVAELGVMCRDCISGPCSNRKAFYATPDEYAAYDFDSLPDDTTVDSIDPWYCERPTQAIALSDLLIFLLESRLITVEEVNQRLLSNN